MLRTRVEPRAERNEEAQGRHLVSVLLLSTLVTTASLTVVLYPRPASADQIGDLRAQAAAIAQRLIRDQLEVDAYRQQYSVVSERVTADAQNLGQIGRQIDQDQRLIISDTADVRRQAINSYMNAGTDMSGSVAVLFSGNAETSEVANEYATIATENIQAALDQLHVAQRTLQQHEAVLEQQQVQDQSDQTRQATALGQANGTEVQLESTQRQVTGQLAAAVAAQAAAQAAKAAAAVVAAQRAATNVSVPRTTSTSTTASTPTPPAGSDPALNPFLQCVVQAESGGNYQAVSPDGQYMGAFQFSQATWNTAAQAAGRPDLVGVPPNLASKADQDAVAVALYALDGQQPWLGDRCSP
jgi:transglycosylase-like protein